MNTQNIHLLKVVSKATTIANVDTLATNNQKRAFTTADLWNIQRHGRTSLGRRRTA